MTAEEKKTLTEVCERIQEEQEPIEFQRLVVELLGLLEEVAPKKKFGLKSELKHQRPNIFSRTGWLPQFVFGSIELLAELRFVSDLFF
jgi:hypothetical protein